jgi:cytochrome c peroxidase
LLQPINLLSREGQSVKILLFRAAPGAALAGALLLAGCAEPPAPVTDATPPAETQPEEAAPVAEPDPVVRDERLDIFQPLPELMESPAHSITLAKVNLGRKLFFDVRLSKNQDISCNSCHVLGQFGVDGMQVSEGYDGVPGTRNTPTVYNAAGQLAQFRDGRATDVEEQAAVHILSPAVMAMADEEAVVTVLKSIPAYAPMFAAAFPEDTEDPITFANTTSAIGAFERGLTTPSRFDNYIAGDNEALSPKEIEGLTTFLDVGCGTCHTGAYIGGSMYRKLGEAEPWVERSETPDPGRFAITGDEADTQVFKVPSLRNVSHTAPYFHDGSVASLNEAVRLMATHQLGAELSNEQVISIIAFLNALDGEPDAAYVAMPELPASSEATPAPDSN